MPPGTQLPQPHGTRPCRCAAAQQMASIGQAHSKAIRSSKSSPEHGRLIEDETQRHRAREAALTSEVSPPPHSWHGRSLCAVGLPESGAVGLPGFGRSPPAWPPREDRDARVWSAATGEPLRTLAGHTGEIYSLRTLEQRGRPALLRRPPLSVRAPGAHTLSVCVMRARTPPRGAHGGSAAKGSGALPHPYR